MRHLGSCIATLTLVTLTLAGCSANPDGQGDGFAGSSGSGAGATGGAAGNAAGSGGGGTQGIDLDDGGAGATTSGGSGGLDGCATSTAKAEFTPALIQLVVDSSGSMAFSPPNSTLSKWDVTSAALKAAVPKIPDSTALGLIFFPDLGINMGLSCFSNREKVVIGPLSQSQRDRIDAAITAGAALGGTPTHAAFAFAAKRLAELSVAGNKFVILITDGEPTYNLDCSGDGRTTLDNTPLIAAVKAAREAQGIRTFVVGSPGSETARTTLSRMATEGGTARTNCANTAASPCHFDMTTAADFGSALADGLAQISGSTLSCEFEVPDPGDGQTLDPGKVNVQLTTPGGQPETIKQAKDDTCTEGWRYSADGERVLLCSATCDRAKAASGTSINVVYGCATEVPQ